MSIFPYTLKHSSAPGHREAPFTTSGCEPFVDPLAVKPHNSSPSGEGNVPLTYPIPNSARAHREIRSNLACCQPRTVGFFLRCGALVHRRIVGKREGALSPGGSWDTALTLQRGGPSARWASVARFSSARAPNPFLGRGMERAISPKVSPGAYSNQASRSPPTLFSPRGSDLELRALKAARNRCHL